MVAGLTSNASWRGWKDLREHALCVNQADLGIIAMEDDVVDDAHSVFCDVFRSPRHFPRRSVLGNGSGFSVGDVAEDNSIASIKLASDLYG